ncbi:porin family protein [Alcanivorax marinus]|uniref:Porin family protein n=1 Tax=Alloalcanivorax marinus TaxID=1177169 RepID=A0A9Q3YQP9_9GAMM|nr:outer membrane beta-barrel protein [Alloalcanivorax marinus]MCC4310020.1 porin family protein [Alloalcanivorax marinus]MCU5787517.1 OmpA domain-containing protein [Alloalcanivorax marinus]
MKLRKAKFFGVWAVGVIPLVAMLALPGNAQAREGLFLGVGAGWSGSDVEMDFGQGIEINGIAADGLAGLAFAGYGWRGRRGFFAVEANMSARNADAEIRAPGGKGKVESSTSYGLGVLLGSELEAASPYLRLGWQVANYEVQDLQSDDQDHNGFRYGLGALLPLQEGLDMRLEWTQTRYGAEKYFQNQLEVEPTENLFSVALSLRY